MRDLVPGLRHFVASSLIDDQGWAELEERVGDFPACAVVDSWAGFEFRLGDPRASTDLSFAVMPGHPLLDDPALSGGLAERMSEAGSGAGISPPDWFKSAFLEYDLVDASPSERRDPGVFLCARLDDAGASGLRGVSFAAARVARAVGWAHSEDREAAVQGVIRALPEGVAVTQVGAMPRRGSQAIRLIIRCVDAQTALGVLDRVGWPGSTPTVRGLLAATDDAFSRVSLAVDVSVVGISPRLGLELYASGGGRFDDWLTTAPRDWRAGLESLQEMGLCLTSKAQGLLAFPGRDTVFGDHGMFVLYRGIDHVKLVVHHDAVQAKAYAGFRFMEPL